MSEKILTVITVTKNCVDTIAQALDSVSAVKTAETEFIVIDGASTDGTLGVLREHEPLIDQLISEPDLGIYNAMNKGVVKSHGRYIVFLNGDDQIEPNGFRSVLPILKQGVEKMICATTLVATTNETLIANPRHLWFYNSIPHPSSFVKAELLRTYPFREDLKIAADYDFFLNSYLRGNKFLVVPHITAVHRRGGASSDSIKALSELKLIRKERLGLLYFPLNGIDLLHRFWNLLARKIKLNLFD